MVILGGWLQSPGTGVKAEGQTRICGCVQRARVLLFPPRRPSHPRDQSQPILWYWCTSRGEATCLCEIKLEMMWRVIINELKGKLMYRLNWSQIVQNRRAPERKLHPESKHRHRKFSLCLRMCWVATAFEDVLLKLWWMKTVGVGEHEFALLLFKASEVTAGLRRLLFAPSLLCGCPALTPLRVRSCVPRRNITGSDQYLHAHSGFCLLQVPMIPSASTLTRRLRWVQSNQRRCRTSFLFLAQWPRSSWGNGWPRRPWISPASWRLGYASLTCASRPSLATRRMSFSSPTDSSAQRSASPACCNEHVNSQTKSFMESGVCRGQGYVKQPYVQDLLGRWGRGEITVTSH